MNKLLEFFILLLMIINGGYSMKMEAELPKNDSDYMTENTAGNVLPAEVIKPVPGKRSMENLLFTAKEPLGDTMYVWGGGWNEEDTGAGIEAVTIGVSPRWKEFTAQQDADYNFKDTEYQIHDGLDCSGYVGWVIYNVFETENGSGEEDGYVMKASSMAEAFAGVGWGTYRKASEVTEWKPGDIMSMEGHVWICLGMCDDGSVLLMHSSPPGVRISGTYMADGRKSQAVELAEQCMRQQYPRWFEKYPECGVKNNYLTTAAQMRWNETLSDEYGIREMDAYETVEFLFQ